MSTTRSVIKIDDPSALSIIHELRGLETRLRDKHTKMQDDYNHEWDKFNTEVSEDKNRIMERLRFALGQSDISGYVVNAQYLEVNVAFLEPTEEEIEQENKDGERPRQEH